MAAPNILGDAAQQVEGSWLGQKAMGMGDMLQRMSEDPWFAAAVMASMLPVGAAGGALRGARPPAAPGAAARAGRAARLRRPGMRNATAVDETLMSGRAQTMRDPYRPPSSPTEGLLGGDTLPRGLTNQPVNLGAPGATPTVGARPPPLPRSPGTSIKAPAMPGEPVPPGPLMPPRASPSGPQSLGPSQFTAAPASAPPTPAPTPPAFGGLGKGGMAAVGGAAMAGPAALSVAYNQGNLGRKMRGEPLGPGLLDRFSGSAEAAPIRATPGPMAVARKEPPAPAPEPLDSGYAPPKSFGDVFGSKGYEQAQPNSTYNVKRGDTLYDIAQGLLRAQGLDDSHEAAMRVVDSLMQANGITDPRKLRAGSTLQTGRVSSGALGGGGAQPRGSFIGR